MSLLCMLYKGMLVLGVHGVVGPRAMPAVDLERRLEQGDEE